MDLIQRIKSYGTYRWNAKSDQRIHSPFTFKLLNEVFYQKSIDTSVENKIEARRKALLQDKTFIEVKDLGAGANQWATTQRRISDIAKTSLKRKKYAQLIYRIVRHFKPQTTLEMGTSLGITTSYIGQGYPAGKVITIEGCPQISKVAAQTFHQTNTTNIIQYTGSFEQKLPEVFEQFPLFDIVFIDGNHSYAPTVSYFEQALNHAHNDTVFIMDDIHWSKGMEDAWNKIVRHPKVTISIDIYEMGFVFIRQENKEPKHFIIKY